jgi:hypothetical protein
MRRQVVLEVQETLAMRDEPTDVSLGIRSVNASRKLARRPGAIRSELHEKRRQRSGGHPALLRPQGDAARTGQLPRERQASRRLVPVALRGVGTSPRRWGEWTERPGSSIARVRSARGCRSCAAPMRDGVPTRATRPRPIPTTRAGRDAGSTRRADMSTSLGEHAAPGRSLLGQ